MLGVTAETIIFILELNFARIARQMAAVHPPLHSGLYSLNSAPVSGRNAFPGPESADKGIRVFVAQQIGRLIQFEQ